MPSSCKMSEEDITVDHHPAKHLASRGRGEMLARLGPSRAG